VKGFMKEKKKMNLGVKILLGMVLGIVVGAILWLALGVVKANEIATAYIKPFGDIFVSQSKDMEFWGRHRHMMSPVRGDESAWQCTKIGAGPVPIETDEGWLLIYHGVITTCNGFVYRMGAALLDLEQPWKVLARSREYLLAPHEYYECVGDVPNVVFPCAALTDADTGRIAIYYGCADTVTGLAFTTVDEILDYIRK